MSLRGLIGVRRRDGRLEEARELERQLRVSRLADHIKAVVDKAPPLTDEQVAKLRALLGGA